MIIRNLFANFLGKFWTALISILVVPLYIRYLGIEAYGVIGLALSVQAMLSLLDFGLSYAINREYARRDEQAIANRANILRTFEICYLAIASGIFVLLISIAGTLSEWVNPAGLHREEIADALKWFAAVVALSWPMALYVGALNGLEKQVSANILGAGAATLRAVGGVAVLAMHRQDLISLFAWQALVGLAMLMITRQVAWADVAASGSRRGSFSWQVVREQARYAAGVSVILIALTALGQLDKIVVSRMLPLEDFGHYSLAATVAVMLGYLVAPITTAVFPKFVQLLHSQDKAGLSKTYHASTQMIGCLVIPVATAIAIHAQDILALWTRNEDLAHHTALLLSILLIASAFNLMTSLSYSLQAAAGRNRPVALIQLVSIIVVTPMLLMAVSSYGKEGAAVIWMSLFLGQFLVGPWLMHKHLLQGEYGRWLTWGVILPSALCISAEMILAAWIAGWQGPSQILGWGLTWFLGSAGYALAAPALQQFAKGRILTGLNTRKG